MLCKKCLDFFAQVTFCFTFWHLPSATSIKKEHKLEKSILMSQIIQLLVKSVGRKSAAGMLGVFGWVRSYQKTGNTFEKIKVILFPYKALWCQQLMCTVEGEGDRFLKLARF